MIISRACEYGIQAVLYLAKYYETPYISIKEIADKNDLSFHFLGKVLHQLTQKGILISYKGPRGGVSLARSPHEMTVLQVMEAIDGDKFFKKCFVGKPSCDGTDPCAFHKKWSQIRDEEIYTMLGHKSIAQVGEEK